jgi:hypothetical protein
MNQQNFLYEGDIEDSRTLEICDAVDKNPEQYHLFEVNPLNEVCIQSLVEKVRHFSHLQ